MAAEAEQALASGQDLYASTLVLTLLSLAVNNTMCRKEHCHLVRWLVRSRELPEASLDFVERFAAMAGCDDLGAAVALARIALPNAAKAPK